MAWGGCVWGPDQSQRRQAHEGSSRVPAGAQTLLLVLAIAPGDGPAFVPNAQTRRAAATCPRSLSRDAAEPPEAVESATQQRAPPLPERSGWASLTWGRGAVPPSAAVHWPSCDTPGTRDKDADLSPVGGPPRGRAFLSLLLGPPATP